MEVDEGGGVDLDLGTKKVRLTFDHRLARVLLDEAGQPLKALPRTGVDPAKLEAATTLLNDLDEDVAAIAQLRTSALEVAMGSGRAWSPTDFDAIWVKHSLMLHLATAIVWEARGAKGSLGRFRVAEDKSFADANDEAFALPKGATEIAVAHVATMPTTERDRWREVFADYRIVQPFEQLAREVPPPGFAFKGPRSAQLDHDEVRKRLERMGFVSNGRDFVAPLAGGVYAVVTLEKDSATGSAVKEGVVVPVDDAGDLARSEVARALAAVAS